MKIFSNTKLLLIAILIIFVICLLYKIKPDLIVWGTENPTYYSFYNYMRINQLPLFHLFAEPKPFTFFLIIFPLSFIPNLKQMDFSFLYLLSLGIWTLFFLYLENYILKKLSIKNDKKGKFLSLTFILLIISYNSVFTRLDIIAYFLIMLSISFFLLFLKLSRFKYEIISIVLLSIAINLNVSIILLLPIFIIVEIRRKNYKNILLTLAVFLFLSVINIAIISNGKNNTIDFFDFRGDQKTGIQVESIYIVPNVLLHQSSFININVNPKTQYYEINNYMNIQIIPITILLICIMVLSIYLITIQNIKNIEYNYLTEVWNPITRERNTIKIEDTYLYNNVIILSSTLLILSYLIFSNALLAQYVIIIIILIPLFSVLNINKTSLIRILVLISAITILTVLINPILYKYLININSIPEYIILIRNISFIVLYVLIFIEFYNLKKKIIT